MKSVAELYGRVVSTVLTLAKENLGKTVFIGAHATPIRAVETYARGYSADLMCEIPWPTNASVSVYAFDGERLTPVRYSFDEFMQDEVAADHTLKY